jgi:thymidylate synthase (FAD)
MSHKIVPNAEIILGKETPVLDRGFVKLVDYMGNDARICEAARVSYGEGTKTVNDDKNLIDFLLRNQHTSPFEKVVFEFHIKLPIYVARQFIRHRTARVSEISGRYSVMKDEFYFPEKHNIKRQSKTNRQCSGEVFDSVVADRVLNRLQAGSETAYATYEQNLNEGVSREIARITLPLNLYTEWYWQIDLHNLMNFLKLRLAEDAQYEIREYAKALFDISSLVCPYAMASFNEHILEGVYFSKTQKEALLKIVEINKWDTLGLSKTDIADFKKKLNVE